MTKLDVLRAAQKGKTAPQILRQAFPGTSLVRSQEAPIRVLLVDEAPRFIIAGQSDLLLFDTANPKVSARCRPATVGTSNGSERSTKSPMSRTPRSSIC